MAKQVSSPPAAEAAEQLDAVASNLALLAGREPTKELCDTLANNMKIFSYMTIATAVCGKLTDRDIFQLIAAGPVQAANMFKAAQQGWLEMQVAHKVKVFMGTIGFKYPKPDSAPEDAAVELAQALDHAVAEARKMKEAIKKRPQGHQADANLNTFMAHLLAEASPGLTHERLIEFISTAILMVVHKGREMLNITDGLTRGQQHAALARLQRYEQLDESAIARRIKRLWALLKRLAANGAPTITFHPESYAPPISPITVQPPSSAQAGRAGVSAPATASGRRDGLSRRSRRKSGALSI